MRLHGDAFLLLVLDTLCLLLNLFKSSVSLLSTVSQLLTFSFSHFSMPVLISPLLGDISQGAEE